MSKNKIVGVIGLGMLGRGIVERLLDCHTNMGIYSRNQSKVEEMRARGIRSFRSPRKLADECDFVIICVTNYQSLKQVFFQQDDGLAYSNNNGLVVSDFTTVKSSQSIQCSKLLKKKGVILLSSPVMGGPKEARSGELVTMVSGDKKSFEEFFDIYNNISKKVFYLGKLNGTSNSVKLALNLNIAIITLALCEGLVLANHMGIDSKTYLEIFNHTKFKTGISESKGYKIISGDYLPSFHLKNMLKDLNLIVDTGRSLNAFIPMTYLSQQLFQAAGNYDGNLNEKDYSSVYQFLDALNHKAVE
ncbi:MAG: NAD(P)-dependent oxidoreductase [Thermoproteota archaeon]|nr:NAD(P)-dependent oxidoreductase [Thermoproteota archaeon]